jgi:hypothetical protein
MDAATSSPVQIVSARSSRFAAMQMDLGNIGQHATATAAGALVRWLNIRLPQTNASAEEA